MKETQYSYYTTFNIHSENDLDDFWSFIIFRLNLQSEKEIYDRFARLYNLLLMHDFVGHHKVTIKLYETSTSFLLKLQTNIVGLIDKMVYKLNYYNFHYEKDNDALVYSIVKREKEDAKSFKKVDKELKIFTFIAQDDLDDLTNVLEKMQTRDYSKVTELLTLDELNDYKMTFSYFATMSKPYAELAVISNIVAELSIIISLYLDRCLENAFEVRAFFRALISSLETWLQMLFITGCETPSFMNDSFLADLDQFKMLLGLYDEIEMLEEEVLDTVFDF